MTQEQVIRLAIGLVVTLFTALVIGAVMTVIEALR